MTCGVDQTQRRVARDLLKVMISMQQRTPIGLSQDRDQGIDCAHGQAGPPQSKRRLTGLIPMRILRCKPVQCPQLLLELRSFFQ